MRYGLVVGKKNRDHPLYFIWASMKQRCLNKKDKGYKWYGGRGITIYEPWLQFSNFVKDIESIIGPKPNASLSFDRKDNDKGYYPDNVRWATVSEQNNNRRPGRRKSRDCVY